MTFYSLHWRKLERENYREAAMARRTARRLG